MVVMSSISLNKEYATGPRDYLERARYQLDTNFHENLFYACLNLRCGVEARMRSYLEPYEHISKTQKNEWNLGKLNSSCEHYFKTHQQIQKIQLFSKEGIPLSILYYIPVSLHLIKNANKLGNYLHDMKAYREKNDPWWIEFRTLLEDTYSWLDFTCQGKLLGPAMWKPSESMTASLNVELIEKSIALPEMLKKGDHATAKVEYFPINKQVLP